MPKQDGNAPEPLSPLMLRHSALYGYAAPIAVGPEAEAVQHAGGAVPEPLRPIDPAQTDAKPGTKIE